MSSTLAFGESPDNKSERIAQLYMDYLQDSNKELPNEPKVHLEDINHSLIPAAQIFNFFGAYDAQVPSLKIGGDLTPVNLYSYYEEGRERYSDFPEYDVDKTTNAHLINVSEFLIAKKDFKLQRQSIASARDSIFTKLKKFLSSRLEKSQNSSDHNGNRNPPRNSHFHDINLITASYGSTIEVSPAYFIDWIYFHAPSSPSSGRLLGGTWAFASRNGTIPRRQSASIVEIPQTLNIHLNDI